MLRKLLIAIGAGCLIVMSFHGATALANPDRSLLTLSQSVVAVQI